MLARDIMSKPVVQIHRDEDLEAAARAMLEHDIGSVAVVDEGGLLVGILTETDFQGRSGVAPFSMFSMPKLFGRYIDMDGLERIYAEARTIPVHKVMQASPATLPEDAKVEDVARVMVEKKVRHVLIVRDRRPVGMVARRDLLRMLARH